MNKQHRYEAICRYIDAKVTDVGLEKGNYGLEHLLIALNSRINMKNVSLRLYDYSMDTLLLGEGSSSGGAFYRLDLPLKEQTDHVFRQILEFID